MVSFSSISQDDVLSVLSSKNSREPYLILCHLFILQLQFFFYLFYLFQR